jgi:hypothetical protein
MKEGLRLGMRSISPEFAKIVNQLNQDSMPGRMFDLEQEPTRCELRHLIDINYAKEISITHCPRLDCWILTEGKENEVEIPRVDDQSLISIFVHLHPKPSLRTTPSAIDIINANPRWKQFVFDNNGILQYSSPKFHPLTGLFWKGRDKEAITIDDLMGIRSKCQNFSEEMKFVEKMSPDLKFKAWHEVSTEKPFSNF